MIELQSLCGLNGRDFAVLEYGSASDPNAYGPSSQRFASPRGPLNFGELFGVFNGSDLIWIDKREVRIVSHLDAAFADDAPDSRRCIAGPARDLFPRAKTSRGTVEQ